MSESEIMKRIQIALSQINVRVWRNNVGSAKTMDGRHITFGLAVGSSDLIGLTSTGRFVAIEVKTATGKVTEAQLNFINMVKLQGGIAGICRSPEEAIELIRWHP